MGWLILGVWKYSLDDLYNCVNSLTRGSLTKFLDETASAQLNELVGLLKKLKDGDSPPSLEPFCLNEFLKTVIGKLPWFFHFKPENGCLCLFAQVNTCSRQGYWILARLGRCNSLRGCKLLADSLVISL